MAHILPENLPQTLPAETLRVFRALKTLPDSYYIWHHLAPWEPTAPDFLLLNGEGRALLVKVSQASAENAFNAAQMALLSDSRKPLGEAEGAVLRDFVLSVGLPGDAPLETLVIFPNIAEKQVQESRITRGQGEPAWAGKELLQTESGDGWERLLPGAAMDSLWLEKLRQRFTPEVLVPSEMTVRPPVERRISAGLHHYLLDYDQEAAVKLDLDMPEDGQGLVNDLRLNIINGVAGSGKTLILLYRLRLLYHFFPGKRFLVLTHNRPLIHDMQGRFARLEGRQPDNIEWRTFNGWCYHHWPQGVEWAEPLWLGARKSLVQAVWQAHLQSTPISAPMFQGEIDWFKDQPPMNRQGYIEADRRGRGFGLSAEQRSRVYDAMLAYQKGLEAQNALDWGDVPRRLWKFAEEGRASLPQYDMVLIDEAQFFAPLWFRLIQRCIDPKTGHLFIVADPTQGFLGRGASWRSLGLEARGRTHRLRQSYRTTREIMQFAGLLYRARLIDEKEDDILIPDLLNMPSGVLPEIIPLTSPQDEMTRVANEVAQFVKQGFPKKHLLVLHTDGYGVRNIIQAIDDRLGKNAARDPKDTFPGDYVRVTTINAGGGLESPIVFLVGLHSLFEEEQSLRLSDEEREMLMRDNTRKLYMAATRAGQRLVMTYVGELPPALQKALGRN
jgi:hypothetical protein